MKCLVVDNSATVRRIVGNTLESMGFDDVVEASDGVEALRVYDSSVRLVITDWNMPLMGGLELVERIRSHPEGARTPILMVTTRSSKDDFFAAVRAGVTSYLVKPFTPGLLRDKIDELLVKANEVGQPGAK